MKENEITKSLTVLEEKAEALSFDIASGLDSKLLHRNSIELIVGIAEFKAMIMQDKYAVISSSDENEQVREVNKVSRRLKRWANNQSQINAKILNVYLKLERDGVSHITESILKSNFGDDAKFYKNFPQMKIISSKNHGKVFDVVDDGRREKIIIWEPVKRYVAEYAEDVGILI